VPATPIPDAFTTGRGQSQIEARDLVKRYGDFVAVDGITFDVPAGACFGFLGPNGAGKTTTIRMITCFSPVTSGSLRVVGHDVATEPRAVKSRIGLVPQDENLDPDLPVRQNLEVYARYYGLPRMLAHQRIDEQLRFFQLEDKAEEAVSALSGGMRRRLLIARALVHQPDLLVLDEPTVGLDPQARHLVWQQLRLLRERGVTLLLTTHYMDEAEQLCDYIVIMHGGHILAEASPRALIATHAGEVVLELRLPEPEARRLLGGLDQRAIDVAADVAASVAVDVAGALAIESFGDRTYLFGAPEAAAAIARQVDNLQVAVLRPGNLEDVFLRLTGRGLVE